MNIATAARFLADQWPVFACAANKRPVTEHGLKDATTDPATVAEMFRRPGAAMIGVPTGRASGFFAVDLDVKNGGAGLEWLEANRHRLPRTRTHRTQSGGLHLLFAMPAHRAIRNSASKIGPGVDVRGDGGYVVVPPSAGYSIADDAMPAEPPEWLLDLLDPPRPAEPPRAPARLRDDGRGSPYALAALSEECDAILTAGFGSQEHTLNAAALKMGALAAGGEIDAAYARESLISAGNGMASQPGREPWTPQEVQAKVERAFRDGMARPRNAPPREVRHVVRVEIVPPEPPPRDDAPEWAQAEPEPFIPMQEASRPRQATARAPFGLIWFHEIEPRLDALDFVQGFLTEAAGSVVYGDSNAGKTFMATDLALHVAAGKRWMGRRVEQGGVVYCVLEGGFGFQNRVEAWRRAQGLHDARIPFAAIQAPINMLNAEADVAALVASIQAAAAHIEMPVKLVVIDTLARALAGGDENSPEDMGALVKNMDAVRHETGAHVMFIHHSGKDQARGARGHSSLRAAIDTEVEVTADEESGARQAKVVKQRDLPKGQMVHFTLKVVELGENRHGETVTSCVVEASDEAPAASRQRIPDDAARAMQLLHDLCGGEELPGIPGIPGSQNTAPSVTESAWREAFYSRAKPGADYEAKKKAFRRAADLLVKLGKIGVNGGRVWPC